MKEQKGEIVPGAYSFLCLKGFQQSFDADIDEGLHEMAMQCYGLIKVRGTYKCRAFTAANKYNAQPEV